MISEDQVAEAIQIVRDARRNCHRLEDELHQAEASLHVKELEADRLIDTWLRERRERAEQIEA